MNLYQLYEAVKGAISRAIMAGDDPNNVVVSIQVDVNKESVWSDDVELHYDGDLCASGCVIVGDNQWKQ